MMTSKHQKTIDQSRDWLINAFFEQLEIHPYHAITVSSIAEQAQLSRRTFYRHFKTKDDLLQQYLIMIFNQYTELLLQKKIARHEDTLQLFFTFWQNYAHELRLLQKHGLYERVLSVVNQWYPTIYRELQAPWHVLGSPQEILYASSFGAGGYFNILSCWIQRGCPETPEEMTHIAAHILQALTQEA